MKRIYLLYVIPFLLALPTLTLFGFTKQNVEIMISGVVIGIAFMVFRGIVKEREKE